ncbi:antibiotic biosynthesis monooxygenase [marine bacterium AO1-C]|nr:antibiotic biosynthesis monooxygenase [marine bacterium AO1-C]
MLAVIFELIPQEGQKEAYFELATELRPLLEDIDGFISIERFQSLNNPQKTLSLSFWRDEASIQQWRNLEKHRMAQAKGRASIFEMYRLRVAEVSRDYGLQARQEAPEDSQGFHSGRQS